MNQNKETDKSDDPDDSDDWCGDDSDWKNCDSVLFYLAEAWKFPKVHICTYINSRYIYT